MIKPITTPGKTYAVTSPNGCTVTTEDGLTLAEVEAGKQGYFVAVSGKVMLSDEAAVLTQVFKLAPQQRLAILGVLGGNAGGLPAGYKRVEWLENTKASWIDTRCFVTSEYSVNIRFFTDVKQPNMTNTVFGKRKTYPVNMFSLSIINTGSQLQPRFGNKAAKTKNFEMHRLYEVSFQNGKYILNSEELSFPKTDYFSADVPLALFTEREESGAINEFFIGRIYECTIMDENNSQAFNGIPALSPTGAPCMFDMVSRQPFYNLGTGDFLYQTESTTYSLRRVLPDWGKLTEHGLSRLYHAPASYKGELYDYALENGYKPIIETEKPEEGYWTPRWTETEEEIILEWVETEPPMDEPLTETE